MKASYFNYNDGSYTITTPRTPTPWSMPLFNDNYYTFIDQLLQGTGYYLTSKTYRKALITPGDRMFWLRDKTSGKCWKINDSKAITDYNVTYYTNQIEMVRCFDGVTVKICIFVPLKGKIEYWKVTLINNTQESKELSLFSHVGMESGSGMGGTCKQVNNAIIKYAFPYHVAYEEKEKCETYCARYYLLTDTMPASCDMSEYHFYGGYLKDEMPRAVLTDQCSGFLGEVEDFCAVMQHVISLEAGQEKSICFSVGAEIREEKIHELANQFSQELVNLELAESTEYWEHICQSSTIETPNNEFNMLINTWLKKQIVFLTRLNRIGDVCPVRNQLQDAMGYSIFAAEEAKQYMYDVFALQRSDGYIRQWRRTGNGPAMGLMLLDHCDGPIWVALCGCILVSQLGNREILDDKIPYSDSGEGTLLEHMLMAVRYMYRDVGEHGVCLMRDGDWTDPINGIGREGKGESAWTSMGLMLIAKWLRELCEQSGHGEYVEELQNVWSEVDEIVNSVLWEDTRYIGGFDDKGIPFANQEDDNRVLLNVQTWALLCGAARGERAEKVKETIRSISGKLGPYTIYPGFEEWNPQWGRISLKKNGTTENGAVYCHAAMFKAFSDSVLGDGDGMFDTLLRVTPFNPDNPIEKNRQIPLYIPNYYYSLEGSENFGRSSCAYGTGSATWMLLTVLEELFGIKATVNGVQLNPNIPKEWDNVSCTRQYKKAIYEVTYTHSATGITINGEIFEGGLLPYEDNSVYKIVYGL